MGDALLQDYYQIIYQEKILIVGIFGFLIVVKCGLCTKSPHLKWPAVCTRMYYVPVLLSEYQAGPPTLLINLLLIKIN